MPLSKLITLIMNAIFTDKEMKNNNREMLGKHGETG